MNYRLLLPGDRDAINEILALSFNRIYAYFAKKSFLNLQNALAAVYVLKKSPRPSLKRGRQNIICPPQLS
jgi:hypothetical protein